MKTTINLDETLRKQASDLTLIREKTALVHAGLRELIAKASRERLQKLGGSEKNLKRPRRRRSP